MTLTTVWIVLMTLGVEAAADSGSPPVNVRMWAVQATLEERSTPHFDRDVLAIKPAVAELPYDTYKKVAVEWRSASTNENARLPINAVYALLIKPLPDQPDGRIRLDVCVEMKKTRDPGAAPVKALQTTIALAPKKMINLRGFRLENGNELLVVVSADR